jgi:RNA polymerase sigma-70 factor, ECF subfamily
MKAKPGIPDGRNMDCALALTEIRVVNGQPDELLERFAQGDEAAFEQLFRQFQGDIYGWIVQVIRDPGVAEELVVETFLRIHRSRQRFDSTRNFASWARRIAVNLAISHLRRNRPEVPADEAGLENFGAWQADSAVAADIQDRVRQAFAKLPPAERAVAAMAYIEERSHEEIAQSLAVPKGTVKSRLFRASRLLRKHLAKLGVTP